MPERYLTMEFSIEGVEVYHDGDWKNFENPYKVTVVFGEVYNQELYREKPFNFDKWKKQVWSWCKKGVPSVEDSTVDGFCIWLKDKFSEMLKDSEKFLYSIHVEDSKGNKITYTK
jgi:hypothetical protein